MTVRPSSFRAASRAFTLVEMLVSAAVLALMLAIVAGITGQATKTVSQASATIDAFQAGRGGFDILANKLSQATLNTYWDYDDPNTPTRYTRRSDLHFLVEAPGGSHSLYFQAPVAYSRDAKYQKAQGLLSACGYYVDFVNDAATQPGHITEDRWRYRLMQALQPAEKLKVFKTDTATWKDDLSSIAWPIADNVIAMVAWPRTFYEDDVAGTGSQLTGNYSYDSRSSSIPVQYAQLPPMVQVTLIMIDEASAKRLDNGATRLSVIEGALSGRFTDVTKFESDLDAVQTALADANINCRTLTAPVTLRESKWSQY